MNKLVEAFEIKRKCNDLLFDIQMKYKGIYLCFHTHYNDPVVSIYRENTETKLHLKQNGIVYHISDEISEELADEVISEIEKAFNEN